MIHLLNRLSESDTLKIIFEEFRIINVTNNTFLGEN